MFTKGDKVKMTENALENYGEENRDTVFTILYVASNRNEHPGYDEGVSPQKLYDLETPAGAHYPNSLYDYELEDA